MSSTRSEATRAAISRAIKAQWDSPAFRLKRLAQIRCKPRSPSSESERQRFRDPTVRAKALSAYKASTVRSRARQDAILGYLVREAGTVPEARDVTFMRHCCAHGVRYVTLARWLGMDQRRVAEWVTWKCAPRVTNG